MKPINICNFLKSHIWLLVILILAPIVSICGYVYIYGCIDDSAASSLISGVFTYIGSSILALFVYYHSWIIQKTREKLDRLNIIIEPRIKKDSEEKYLWSFEEIESLGFCKHKIHHTNDKDPRTIKYQYLKLKITNRGLTKIDLMFLRSIYIYCNGNTTKQDYTYICSDNKLVGNIIDYRESQCIYIGINKEHFNNIRNNNKEQTIAFIFYITDSYSKKYAYVGTISINKEECRYENRLLLEKNDFNRLITKKKHPVELFKSIKGDIFFKDKYWSSNTVD